MYVKYKEMQGIINTILRIAFPLRWGKGIEIREDSAREFDTEAYW